MTDVEGITSQMRYVGEIARSGDLNLLISAVDMTRATKLSGQGFVFLFLCFQYCP